MTDRPKIRTKGLNFRVTPQEHKSISSSAKKLNKTMTDYIIFLHNKEQIRTKYRR